MPDENLDKLLYWCEQRECMRLAKLVGSPPPYVDDPILSKYRFCNLHRRDDRVSKWLIANVLTEDNIDYDLKSFLMFSAWCRWVNWPPTIKAVMEAGFYPKKRIDWKRLGKFVDDLGKKGKVWTGAYMIRAPKKAGAKKGKYVSEVVVGTNFKAMLPAIIGLLAGDGEQPSYQDVWRKLQEIDGYGSFMSGQIAGDWTYTGLLNQAADLQSFAPMGPGSVRGFNRVMGFTPIGKRPSQALWEQKLIEWRAAIIERLGDGYSDLTALDVQNALCECDKYLRVLSGEGRPRAYYVSHEYV